MILRQSFNFALHLAGGIAVGVLAVYAAKALANRHRDDLDDWPATPEASDFAAPEAPLGSAEPS